MTSAAENIRLTVPAPNMAHAAVETRPARITEWLSTLPYADNEASAHHIHEAVFVINRFPLDAQRRFEVMELFLEPSRTILQEHVRTCAAKKMLLRQSAVRSADAISKLAIENAHGYKLAINELTSQSTDESGRIMLATAIQRAMEFLSQVLLNCYICYLSCPANVWRELNQLFEYAETNGMQDLVPAQSDDAAEPEISISNIYKRILCCSVADPYAMSGPQMVTVFQYVKQWAEQALITPLQPAGTQSPHFLIDLRSDSPPRQWSRSGEPQGVEQHRLLDTMRLAELATEHLKQIPQAEGAGDSEGGSGQLSRVLEHMAKVWGEVRDRRHSRTPCADSINVVAGIAAVRTVLLEALETVPEGAESIVMQEEGDAPVYQWSLRNESAGGIAAAGQVEPHMKLGVGQVVAVKHPSDDEKRWTVGTVRHLHTQQPPMMDIGIEYLPDIAQPAELWRADDEQGAEQARPVLVLGTDDSQGASRQIIAPKGLYRATENFNLSSSAGRERIRAGLLLESTDHFDRFRVMGG